ncbi:VRR-NUC domain-containing protein [Marinoscillum sp. MHG1-6]|uniref:VRR-NUC domain-containing protein n=1 Tax=Marinoscillum sp. MHG1-6 TaxID=2959627 RepID=UPI002158994E|nr:VRR-NUC domain-containing protein [Marinoscillum sp. MHG1-6]
MPDKEPIILPPKYYLDYFNYLIEFVTEFSGHLLGDVGENFIHCYKQLDENSQCTMIRMANRKGEYFRLSKFSYEEIDNIGQCIEELIENDFASLDPPIDPLLFNLFTKNELIKIFPDYEFQKLKKDEILEFLAEHASTEDYQLLSRKETIIHFVRQEEVDFLKLLFFGHNHGMMTEFVIRDIGNIKLEDHEGRTFKPWFDCHEEASAIFELSKLNRLIKELISFGLPEEVLDLISPINWSRIINYRNARKPANRLMLRLGEYFEKSGYFQEAITYYELAHQHPGRERRIRIYNKLGMKDEAIDLASFVLEKPYNATELTFAKDFLAKTGARTLRSTTERIKQGLVVEIESDSNKRVEQLALVYLEDQGYQGLHSENFLWRGLFGLTFWQELFDVSSATFHHPLERGPSDLRSEQFYIEQEPSLREKLKTFRSKKQLANHLTETYYSKENINNPLVVWHEDLLMAVIKAVELLPLKGLKKVLLEMARNMKDHSAGFPDLFVWKSKQYHFYEIKSPNDHLSAQQLFWLDFFDTENINADIMRIKYL